MMDTMKKTIIISALGAMFMASCADEFNTNNYVADRPAKTEAYAYLNGSVCLPERLPAAEELRRPHKVSELQTGYRYHSQ